MRGGKDAASSAAACASAGLKWLWAHTHGHCCKLAGSNLCWRMPSSSHPRFWTCMWALLPSLPQLPLGSTVAVSLQNGDVLQCWVYPSALSHSGQQLTHILVTSTCEVQADLFLLFVSLGDFSGQLLAYLSLGPIFIIVGFVTLIIFKRELHTVSFSLPTQLLLTTEMLAFVTWCSCFHTFALCKQEEKKKLR